MASLEAIQSRSCSTLLGSAPRKVQRREKTTHQLGLAAEMAARPTETRITPIDSVKSTKRILGDLKWRSLDNRSSSSLSPLLCSRLFVVSRQQQDLVYLSQARTDNKQAKAFLSSQTALPLSSLSCCLRPARPLQAQSRSTSHPVYISFHAVANQSNNSLAVHLGNFDLETNTLPWLLRMSARSQLHSALGLNSSGASSIVLVR